MAFVAGQPLDVLELNNLLDSAEGYNVVVGGAFDFNFKTNYIEMNATVNLSFTGAQNGKTSKFVINNITGSNQTMNIPATGSGSSQVIDFTPGYTVVDIYWANGQAIIQV